MSASARRSLAVFVSGTRAGTLMQNEHGLRSFSYGTDYAGPPLSLSMPVSNRTYRGRVVDAYLLGLLPDDEHVRRSAGRRFGVSGNNPFSLLSHMGLDCPGAVQFCPEDEVWHLRDEGDLVPLSDGEIAERLAPVGGDDGETWFRAQERWSLGGNQSKFALRFDNGVWCECRDAAASTHIFKPGIRGMRLEALDEYVTMRIASNCGIPAEHVDYLTFEGVPAIVATRYDRIIRNGVVTRIHQEDLCQALSFSPDMKYAEDGGPSTPDVLHVLDRTSDPRLATEEFASMLFFNYLMGAPDAHAKNYSLLHLTRDSCVMAPLYDSASGLPYDLTGGRPLRMAMSIGGENRLGFVGPRHIARFAEMAQMDGRRCLNLMANLCTRILATAPLVLDEAHERGIAGAEELAERLLPKLEAHCRTTLQRL